MKLTQLLDSITYNCVYGKSDIEISNIEYNSKKVRPGDLFICLEGYNTDGHNYVDAAIKNGAVAIVCHKNLTFSKHITVINVENTRIALAHISAAFYEQPAQKLVMIGITGTKGKTTTSFILKEILEKAGYKTGIIGTIMIDTGLRKLKTDNTTPESKEIHMYLREMIRGGCNVAIMEVSSQALMMHRTDGIMFNYGIFTNIEKDHIGKGEHKSFEDYLFWKSRLFTQCNIKFLNADDDNLKSYMEKEFSGIKTFGFNEKCDLYAKEYNPAVYNGKLSVTFKTGKNSVWNVPMAGKFTCYNAMAAMGVAKELNISDDLIQQGFNSVAVPGRQEVFYMEKNRMIMIDFAHNGTALESLLRALQTYHPAAITCVFGCGGERSVSRRIEMGRAAACGADNIVITSDNPRRESPYRIIEDIVNEVKKYKESYKIITDRKQAIEYAVTNCKDNEIVVIAGKGHEDYQIIGTEKIHFDDREIVVSSIEKVNYGKTNN